MSKEKTGNPDCVYWRKKDENYITSIQPGILNRQMLEKAVFSRA
jgi:hypothetical protein